ncbi:hypothetical protein ACGIF2_15705 [Cellulomonas sp. P22]|uniref:hypothetical protein n=1 Tax=Cellulomonas sp. P22 TaxID=3373189 RepID=UPI0037BA722F
MTTTFRIDEIELQTSGGPVRYTFGTDLTVLAGPTGVGKTSLLELVKYALGGDGLLASVAEAAVSTVRVSVRLGAEKYLLSRSLRAEDQNKVEVFDAIAGRSLEDHFVDRLQPRVSDLLMKALDLPTGLRAAPRSSGSSKPGAPITFNDVFRFLYVPQIAINREIAGSSQGYYEPKRRTVFELLFGLTSDELVSLRTDLNLKNSQVGEAAAQLSAVERFLVESGTESRFEAERRLGQAQSQGASAALELERLSAAMTETGDRETQVLRDLLADTERGVAQARALSADLTRQHAEYAVERRRVHVDISRLERMASAGIKMANIEFMACPRCLQSLDREVPEGRCRVCLQTDVVANLPDTGQYEMAQLRSQLDEIDQQLEELSSAQTGVRRAESERTGLIRRLTLQIDQRTEQRVSPRLQAYTDAARRVERSAVETAAIEALLRQWDRVQDLRTQVELLNEEKRSLEARVLSLESNEKERRTEVLTELSEEFQRTVQNFGVPNGQMASINPTNYLPELNGRRYEKVSSAGGIATATQVAYWISLVTVATRRRDTRYPSFLLIDSPRLALNTAEGMAAQMYRRFVAQVGTNPGRLQFIVADNELPREYKREFAEFVFDYGNPTVPTVPHPGPANVNTIGSGESIQAV